MEREAKAKTKATEKIQSRARGNLARKRNLNTLVDQSVIQQRGQQRLPKGTLVWLHDASRAAVVFNVIIMCLRYHDESAAWHALRLNLADACSAFFVLEMSLKLYAFGCRHYWASGWNQLDVRGGSRDEEYASHI